MERSLPFTAINAITGEVVYSGTADDPDALGTEEILIVHGASHPPGGWFDFINGYFPLPARPSPKHHFNYTSKQWEDPRTLADLKEERTRYVNTARLAANQSYFTHQGKRVAVDGLSRSDIDGVNGELTNTGDFPLGWPGAWKCLDNTWLPITTIGQWKAFYSSMVRQGTTNFGIAQSLKAQIEAATTPEEVTSIVWP